MGGSSEDQLHCGSNPRDHGGGSHASSSSSRNFSLRDYVLAARGKSPGHSWPFHPKYLQMCMNHGIKNVLPPFEASTTSRSKTDVDSSSLRAKKASKTNYIKNPSVLVASEANQKIELIRDEHVEEAVRSISLKIHLLSIADDIGVYSKHDGLKETRRPDAGHKWRDFNLKSTHRRTAMSVPSMAKSSKKLEKSKGKQKKRSIADIIKEAKPFTLEELDRINGTQWGDDYTLMPYDHVIEGNGCLSNVDNCQLQDGLTRIKHQDVRYLREGVHEIKKRIKGCRSKPRMRKLSSIAAE